MSPKRKAKRQQKFGSDFFKYSMPSPEHSKYTKLIIDSVRSINPHTNNEGRIAYVYSSGFLASYLAEILKSDPIRLREFNQLIARQQSKHSKKP
jgi:hypothetical protein